MPKLKLKQLRLEKHLKQSDLAKHFNTTDRVIQRWENEENPIKSNILIELAQFFNVSTDYLLGLDDVPNRKS